MYAYNCTYKVSLEHLRSYESYTVQKVYIFSYPKKYTFLNDRIKLYFIGFRSLFFLHHGFTWVKSYVSGKRFGPTNSSNKNTNIVRPNSNILCIISNIIRDKPDEIMFLFCACIIRSKQRIKKVDLCCR